MYHIRLGGITPADRTSLLFWQFEPDDTSKLIGFSCPLHEPVAVDTQDVESVETVVNAHQVDTIRKSLRFELGLRLAERLEAYGASTACRVILLRQNTSEFVVHLVKKTVDFSVFVAQRLQTLDCVSLQHVDLIVVEALARRQLKLRRFSWELRQTKLADLKVEDWS